MRFLYFFLMVSLASPVAYGQDSPPSEPAPVERVGDAPNPEEIEEAIVEGAEALQEVADEVGLLVGALDSKSWPVVVGLLLSILVALARKYALKNKVPKKAVPWVTLSLAVLGTTGAALSANAAVDAALMQGLTAGLAAIGGGEALFKHIGALQPKGP